jgi:geranylgeranyl diphosphate synthase type II
MGPLHANNRQRWQRALNPDDQCLNPMTSTSIAAARPANHRVTDSLAHRQQLIESALDRYTQFSADCPAALREAIRYSLLTPGKRLRPMLVMLAAEACGGNADSAVPAACAVEMIHTYSLIHDDLPAMDDDDIRRGRQTSHRKFGEAVAILAGDALLALAFDVLARETKPPEIAAACCATLASASGPTALVGGQCDDIGVELSAGSIEMLESIHNRKTGALFLASLRLGALVAGATAQQHAALQEFGSSLGLAFQITDDLLDHEEDRRTSKAKRKGDRGKLTYPNLIGVEQSRKSVEQLVTSSLQALNVFGPSARSLHALARFVSDRL